MDYGLLTAPGFALYRSEAETSRAITVHSCHGLGLLGSLWSQSETLWNSSTRMAFLGAYEAYILKPILL